MSFARLQWCNDRPCNLTRAARKASASNALASTDFKRSWSSDRLASKILTLIRNSSTSRFKAKVAAADCSSGVAGRVSSSTDAWDNAADIDRCVAGLSLTGEATRLVGTAGGGIALASRS